MQRLLSFLIKNYFTLTVLLSAMLVLGWYKAGQNKVFLGDGVGYYSYLPAVFIYHDAEFRFMDYFRENYQHVHEFVHNINGRWVNHYFIGEAILLAPFFLAGHAVAVFTDFTHDGFSEPYQVAMLLAGLFYFFLGIFWLKKTLEFVSGNPRAVMIALLALIFGSNLFYYFTTEFLYSHIYSFSAVSLLLYATIRYRQQQELRFLIWAALAIGFICLIRATNLVVLLSIPFFAGSNLKALLTSIKPLWWLQAAVLVVGLVLLQPLAWYIQSGHLFVDAYTKDYFEFGKPHIAEVLWSYYKGWWVYTPLAFFSFAGLWQVFRQKLFGRWMLLLFFAANTYMLASWHYWDYGVTFGQRAFTDTYALLALLLVFATQYFLNHKSLRFLWLVLCLCCVALNIFQTWQYKTHIINGQGMQRAMYWRVFLKWEDKYRFLAFNEAPVVCRGTRCLQMGEPAVGEQKIVKQFGQALFKDGGCFRLFGYFSSRVAAPDARLQISFYSKNNLLGREQVYLLRFMKNEQAREHQVNHYIPLRKMLREADKVEVLVLDELQQAHISELRMEHCK